MLYTLLEIAFKSDTAISGGAFFFLLMLKNTEKHLSNITYLCVVTYTQKYFKAEYSLWILHNEAFQNLSAWSDRKCLILLQEISALIARVK